jgi:hypothetical protein
LEIILGAHGFILKCQVALLAGLISQDDWREMALLPCGWVVCAKRSAPVLSNFCLHEFQSRRMAVIKGANPTWVS